MVVDANLRPSVMPDLAAYRTTVHAALDHAHIIKASDEDLDHLAVPGNDAVARARHLLASHPQAHLLALTLGPAIRATRENDIAFLTRPGVTPNEPLASGTGHRGRVSDRVELHAVGTISGDRILRAGHDESAQEGFSGNYP